MVPRDVQPACGKSQGWSELQIEKVQQLRTETVRDNLLRYIDSLWKDTFDMFDMHVENMAKEKLVTALHGPVMLVTLGKVYKLQAKRAQGNMVAYFKCVASLPVSALQEACLRAYPANVQRFMRVSAVSMYCDGHILCCTLSPLPQQTLMS